MSVKKSYVRRIIEFFIGHSSRGAAYSKARPLQLESLEVREMLSGISFIQHRMPLKEVKQGIFE